MRLPTTVGADGGKFDLTGWIQERLRVESNKARKGGERFVALFLVTVVGAVVVVAGAMAVIGWVQMSAEGPSVADSPRPPAQPVSPAAEARREPEERPAGERAGQVWESRAGLRLVWIPAGEYEMGSDNGAGHEKPVHRVRITRGFWL
ncbi:MAG: hypothetical protein NZ585_13395, partial [Chloracidobacterium sp.]|nr:hypothetical protein [Chloracidobacterium sp.]